MRSPLEHRILVLVTVFFSGAGLGGCEDVPSGNEDTDPLEGALSTAECPDDVPALLAPVATQRLWFVLRGVGVQVYTCSATAAGYEWLLKEPQAELLNSGNQVVGIHYAGPTWESNDGSTVVAVRLESAPSPDPDAIPWLLLEAVSHTGSGRMSHVTSLQRLSTSGGKAPATACDQAHVGAETEVAYAADYFFYRTGRGNKNGNPRCGG